MDETPERWRLFVAIELSAAARGALATAQGTLRALDLPVRWVDPSGAHLTLAFLGETARARVAQIEAALRGVAAAHAPFALRTAAPGAFPNLRQPRVLWLGLAGAVDRLGGLQAAVADALVPLGFPREARPFRPHLTLGRVRAGGEREMMAASLRLIAVFEQLSARPGAALPVREVRLMRSELGRGGARYSTVVRMGLGG